MLHKPTRLCFFTIAHALRLVTAVILIAESSLAGHVDRRRISLILQSVYICIYTFGVVCASQVSFGSSFSSR